MGSGGLQDGPRGLGDIRTWPDKPEEWRKMLQESSKRHTEKAETAKIIKLVWVLKVFGFFRFSVEHASKRISERSETAPNGPKKRRNEPKRL